MTDALVPVDVAALDLLTFDQRVDAIGEAYRRWGRVEVAAAWTFGRALRFIRGNYSKGSGDWGAVLDRIGIERTRAHRYMRLAEGFSDALQIATYRTVDAALKALGPKRLASVEHPVEHPVEEVVEEVEVVVEHPVEHPVEEVEVVVHPEVENDLEAEAARERAELREAMVEGWAMRTEHEDGNEIERLHRLQDKADERERKHVAAFNAERRLRQAAERMVRDMTDALLAGPGCPTCAEVLAKFRGVQRKGAA